MTFMQVSADETERLVKMELHWLGSTSCFLPSVLDNLNATP